MLKHLEEAQWNAELQ